jgi:hypothetical protein
MNIYYLNIACETRRGWSSPPLSIRIKIVAGCIIGNVHLYKPADKIKKLYEHILFFLCFFA